MVPVRKPGRPLSSCPHPPNKNCGCAGVTAAIPRKQQCRCSTSSPSVATTPTSQSTKTGSGKSSEPISPSRAAFRIQKAPSSSSAGSKMTKKLSSDPSLLSRMNSSQLNIMPATAMFSSAPTPSVTSDDKSATFDYMPLAPAPTPFAMETAGSAFNPHHPYVLVHADFLSKHTQNGSHHEINAAAASPMVSLLSMPHTNDDNGSCCSSLAQPMGQEEMNKPPIPDLKPPATRLSMQRAVDGSVGSCCGGNGEMKSGEGKAGSKDEAVPQLPPSTPVLMPGPQYSPGIDMFGQIYPAQPTVYTYPPMYGTYLHPLQPSQWRMAIASTGYANAHPLPSPQVNGYAHPPSQPGTMPRFEDQYSAGPNSTGTTHTCSCGDRCQCIGCAAHPYNEATQRYVRSAMLADSGLSTETAKTSAELTHQRVKTPLGSPTNGIRPLQQPGIADATLAHIDGQAEGSSPPAVETPSDTASNDEQALSVSDFFFVTYPFAGDGCAGDTASCPCGDECQCLGCTIHHNPGGPPTSN